MSVSKNDLLNLRSHRQRIEAIKSEQKEIRNATALATHRLDAVPSGSLIYDKISDSVGKLVDLDNEYTETVLQYAEEFKDTLRQIMGLSEPYYSVIYHRYILHKKWDKVATDLNYSVDGVKKIHAKAIKMLEE